MSYQYLGLRGRAGKERSEERGLEKNSLGLCTKKSQVNKDFQALYQIMLIGQIRTDN